MSRLTFLFASFISLQTAVAQDYPSFAVVELFTSQGCSSCPRADQYLSDIIDDAESDGKKVIALSFHVDYWNRLGWKDPYSSQANTRRQYAYAQSMRSSNVYTPQMVVNGKVEFVGSNRQKGGASIKNALDNEPSIAVQIEDVKVVDSVIEFNYVIQGIAESTVVNAALVEKGIQTRVGRGENGGRTLNHDNVVRTFKSLPLINNEGKIRLETPQDMKTDQASVVVFLQKEGLREIIAADISTI